MGRFFPNFPQNWLICKKILEKIGWFCSKFGPKLGRLVYDRVTFSLKFFIYMGLLSNSAAAHPYQNQILEPPRAWNNLTSHCCLCIHTVTRSGISTMNCKSAIYIWIWLNTFCLITDMPSVNSRVYSDFII